MRALDQVMHYNPLVKHMLTVGKFIEATDAACKVVKNIFEDAPKLGIDLDGTIDEAPEFFKILSHVWPGMVVVITLRADEAKAKHDVAKFGVYFDGLITVKRLSDKAQVIKDLGINVYVDDQDECLANIPEDVTVLKIRNPGNFEHYKWLYSNKTGISIDQK